MGTSVRVSHSPSKLACLACKARKTGCNRAKPTCDGCLARHLKCIYPNRKKREASKRTTIPRNLVDGDVALSALSGRLQQLEAQCSRLINASLHIIGHSTSVAAPRDGPGAQCSASLPSSPRVMLLPTRPRVDISIVAREMNCDGLAERAVLPLDTNVLLRKALGQVMGLRRQKLYGEVVALDSCIRPELSKICVENFQKHYLIDTFPGFINTKLMHLIPEIIDMPEITIDPATLVLYHGVLYHGSLLVPADLGLGEKDLTQIIYRSCLRVMPSWQRQATGTKTDLITAILLMRAGFQQCDFEFSWTMFKLVCKCVQNLNMHNIDQSMSHVFIHPSLLPDGPDHHRKGLWTLVLVDLFFRLLHDKPATMTANLTEWRVNLPWLDAGPENTEHVVSTLTFLVKSRLTFLLLRCFDKPSRDAEDGINMADHVDEICRRIEELFEEWSVRDSTSQHENNVAHWWMLYDLTLTGYCSVMIMMHKAAGRMSSLSGATTAENDVIPKARRVNIARRVMDLVHLSLTKYPSPATASYVFGAFRCYIAYGWLAEHLRNSDPQDLDFTAATDLALLEQIAQIMSSLADSDTDLAPLVRTFHDLNTGIHMRWKEES